MKKDKYVSCKLWPRLQKHAANAAFQMYQTWGHNGKGKAPEDPRFKRQGWETSHAQLLRIMLSGVPTTTSSEPAFDVLILDESHELRNAHTLWSIGWSGQNEHIRMPASCDITSK